MRMQAKRRQQQHHTWLVALERGGYQQLSLEQRVELLCTLVHMAIDGPSVRAAIETRSEEAQRIKKQMWEEAKVRMDGMCHPQIMPVNTCIPCKSAYDTNICIV